jgi:hypothetical protein
MKIEVKDVNGKMMVEVTSILNEKAYNESIDEITFTIIKNFTTLYNLNMIKYNIKFIKKEK